MPRVEEEEGYYEPEEVCRGEGNNQGIEDLVFEEFCDIEATSYLILRDLSLDCFHGDENRSKCQVSIGLLASRI